MTMPMPDEEADVIDSLVGITPGSALDAIRRRRPDARAQAQASYRALFAPDDPGGVSATERFAASVFVAGLHRDAPTASFYAARLSESGAPAELRGAIEAAVSAAGGQGPYGSYPAGPLSHEDRAGPTWRVAPETSQALGPR